MGLLFYQITPIRVLNLGINAGFLVSGSRPDINHKCGRQADAGIRLKAIMLSGLETAPSGVLRDAK